MEGSDRSIGMQHYMDIHISVPAVLIQVHAYRLLQITNKSESREEMLELGFGPVIGLCIQGVTIFHETSSIS